MIRWEEPPPDITVSIKSREWVERLIPVREHLNRWALVAEFHDENAGQTAAKLASNLRNYRKPLPAGKWEFAHRSVGTNRANVYARYLGPPEVPNAREAVI